MSFNKQDLIWSDDAESLESAFFWWDEPEEEIGSSEGSGEDLDQDGIFDLGELGGDACEIVSESQLGTGTEPTTAYSQFARFGPGEKAEHTDLKFDKDISTFVNRLPSKEGNNARPYGIHGVKAAVSLIAYPHKILEQKKTRKADPSITVVVDSYSSYYPDRGVFLNLFASTCERIKIETWRAEKLVNDYECVKAGKKYKGKMLKCEWARKAGIEQGSTVVFVGDGCNGNVGDGFWLNYDLIAFKKLYNPIWISFFKHGMNCGCRTTMQAEKCGWKMYHNISSVSDIKLKRLNRN